MLLPPDCSPVLEQYLVSQGWGCISMIWDLPRWHNLYQNQYQSMMVSELGGEDKLAVYEHRAGFLRFTVYSHPIAR